MSPSVVPRKATTYLAAILMSGVNETLLAAVTVGSLNAGLLSSASAATCVTGVSPTFANVVNGASGEPGADVVTAVTPTFASVTTTQNSFVSSAGINQAPGAAVTSVGQTTGTAIANGSLATGTAIANGSLTTTPITGITPAPGAPATVYVPAFAPNFPTANDNVGPVPPIPPHKRQHIPR